MRQQPRLLGFQRAWRLAGLFFLLLAQSALAGPSPSRPIPGTNEDFSAVSAAVVTLLQTRDAAGFAAALAPRFEDWKSIHSTNTVTHDPDPLSGFKDSSAAMRAEVEQSATALIAQADKLHLDFSNAALHARIVPPRWLGSTHYPTLQAEHESMRYAQKVDIFFSVGATPPDTNAGEFDIAVRDLMRFPGGWRTREGAQWVSFPPGVGDDNSRRELALTAKASEDKGITDKDDPALRGLADALVHFLRAKDVAVYQKDAFVTSYMIWKQFDKQPGDHPSRKDFDEMWASRQRDVSGVASNLLHQLDESGVDLAGASIQVGHISVKRLQSRGPGGLFGEGFESTLAVQSDLKSKAGQSISGDYILEAGQIQKFGDAWRIVGNVRWAGLPDAVIDSKAKAALELDNYVAENRHLPPGTQAPEIAFTRLDGGQSMKLADFRGKIVVLDFWATWCGPCQEPMAKLQSIRDDHPAWRDGVAVVPLSIDDTMAILREHIEKRHWTNTLNVWAGDGGWASAPAKAFRVTGVPTTYIIDQQGKIAKAGHPAAMDIPEEVDALLKTSGH